MEEHFGVKSLALFGSYAKDIQKEDSDIDIFVELKAPEYMWWAGLQMFLEKSFRKKVDVITNGKHLRPSFINYIQKEMIYV